MLQIVCAASAIAAMPEGLIHPLWLATFIMPAAMFLFLGTGNRRGFVPTWARFGTAAVLQAAAAFATFAYMGALKEEASLACSLLPALTYFTLRREPSDTSLSLFLSFCFLLMGIMLSKERANWTLLVFLVACVWAMQIEASTRALLLRHAARSKPMPIGTRVLRRTQIVVALILASFLVYFALPLIPSPGGSNRRGRAPASHNNQRVVGLSSRFDLSGTGGSPLNLTSDRILRVSDSGGSVPRDLYLRMTFFDRAGIKEWTTRNHSSTTGTVDRRRLWCREDSSLDDYNLLIQRLEPAPKGELFVPPGVLGISGIAGMRFHHQTGHYSTTSPDPMRYGVLYERPHKSRRLSQPLDRSSARRHGLLSLPAELRSARLRDLAEQLARPARRGSPMALARTIAAGLQRRCSYALREPTGEFGDSVQNFLFGNNQGYCMHFATALAVMLRLNGIACRIAVGLHAGKAVVGGREYGSRHAHAWVELPLAGKLGWTLVDPTPASDGSRRGWPSPNSANAAGPNPPGVGGAADSACFVPGLMQFLEEPLAILGNPLEHPGAFLTLIGLFLAITLGIVVLVLRHRRRLQKRLGVKRPTPDSIRARRLLEQILARLARRGHPKHKNATLEQYLRALRSDDLEEDLPILAGAFHAYQEVRFGARHLDIERESRLTRGVSTAGEPQ